MRMLFNEIWNNNKLGKISFWKRDKGYSDEVKKDSLAFIQNCYNANKLNQGPKNNITFPIKIKRGQWIEPIDTYSTM